MESASPYFGLISFPDMDRANITVPTNALVSRVIFEGKRAKGVVPIKFAGCIW